MTCSLIGITVWSKSSSLLLLTACALFGQQKFVAEEAHMGTVFRITVYAEEPQVALRAAFDRVAELDRELSDYKFDSELNRICRERGGPISDDLYRVLKLALQLSVDSDGAFDVTLGPVTRLWRLKRVPDRKQLTDVMKRVGYRNVVLGDHRVSLKLTGMQLDLGAIAKGFAAEEALKVLHARGIDSALVAASGDLAIGDPPPGKPGWTVALEYLNERRVVELKNTFVGTSGDTEQFLVANGNRYSHIVDSSTGMGLTTRVGVTVIAPDGMLADALGTALSVVASRDGIQVAQALARKYAGVEALIALDPVVAPEEKRDHQQDRK
jgi:thiamine biosynthesis lipoprotein